MNKNYYAILMAGGVGSRFWPVSTPEFPKQFHDMLGTGETLIQKTFDRLSQLIPKENILILSHEKYRDLLLEQLPELTEEQIILEPEMRNTAPCILYASMKKHFDCLWKKNVCDDVWGYYRLFRIRVMVIIELTGWIRNPIKKCTVFREKPDYITAKKFIQKWNFLWNSDFQPEMYELFEAGEPAFNTKEEKQFIDQTYYRAENISIDYAVMEKAENDKKDVLLIYPKKKETGYQNSGKQNEMKKNKVTRKEIRFELFKENATSFYKTYGYSNLIQQHRHNVRYPFQKQKPLYLVDNIGCLQYIRSTIDQSHNL
ncbi:hypothetical protein FQR65_LT19769 [Abscondita terminalis]|nr:hypothetical protein FQR65_LT19769 [Abscondita terminalis]